MHAPPDLQTDSPSPVVHRGHCRLEWSKCDFDDNSSFDVAKPSKINYHPKQLHELEPRLELDTRTSFMETRTYPTRTPLSFSHEGLRPISAPFGDDADGFSEPGPSERVLDWQQNPVICTGQARPWSLKAKRPLNLAYSLLIIYSLFLAHHLSSVSPSLSNPVMVLAFEHHHHQNQPNAIITTQTQYHSTGSPKAVGKLDRHYAQIKLNSLNKSGPGLDQSDHAAALAISRPDVEINQGPDGTKLRIDSRANDAADHHTSGELASLKPHERPINLGVDIEIRSRRAKRSKENYETTSVIDSNQVPENNNDQNMTNANHNSSSTSTESVASGPDSDDQEKMSRLVADLKQKYIFNRLISDRTYYLVLFVYIVFIIFGSVSNSIICLTVILKPKILSPRNIFILNLASSDLLLCIFTMPFSFIEISSKTWPMGELPCKLVSSLQATSIFVSTISITAIALDRYRVIVYSIHQDSSNRMNTLTGALILLSVWCFALILSLPLFLTRQLKTVNLPEQLTSILNIPSDKEFYFCMEVWPFLHGRGIYSVFSMFIQYVLPITIVSIVYMKISDKLQKRLIRRQRLTQLECQHKRQLQLINRTYNMLITVSLVFGLCWLPLNLLNVISDFTDEILTRHESIFRTVFAICHLIGCFSACSNPILYGYMNENFRKEIIQVYSQQWQKILRYVCRFNRSHSRSTRRTVATTTTTTTSSRSTDSSTASSDTQSDRSGSSCSTSRSSISASDSSSSCSSSSGDSINSKRSRCGSIGGGGGGGFSPRHKQQNKNPMPNNNMVQSISHTAINIQTTATTEANHQLKLHCKRDTLSNSCDIVKSDKPEESQMQQGQKRQHLNRNERNCGGGWLERILVRGVWFMGSMSSCADRTSREFTSTTGNNASNNVIRLTCKMNTSRAKDNKDAINIDNNSKKNEEQRLISAAAGSKKRPNKEASKRTSRIKRAKTKCVCHCHNKNNNKSDCANQGAAGAGVAGGGGDEAILRTRSTGTRPQDAAIVVAEIKLAKANANASKLENPDRAAIGIKESSKQIRRRSSTDKFKTVASGAGKKQLNHVDSINQQLGQRVWLRFFPSMQRYCFNQTQQAAPNSDNYKPSAWDNSSKRAKLGRHCSICRPSSERRRKERREQRRARRLARKEARSQAYDKNSTPRIHKNYLQTHRANDSLAESKSGLENSGLLNEIREENLNADQNSKLDVDIGTNPDGGSMATDELARSDFHSALTSLHHQEESSLIDDSNKMLCFNQSPCTRANCSALYTCTLNNSTNESSATRKESLASCGSKSCGAISLSSSFSCNHSSVSFSTCSCLAHSSLHCNSSAACVDSLSSVGERQIRPPETDEQSAL